MPSRLALGCFSLYFGLWCVSTTAKEPQTKDRSASSDKVIRFEWLASAFSFEVVKVQDGKWLTAKARSQLGVGPTEGDYLAVVFVPQAAGAKGEVLLLTRLRIDEVLADGIRAEILEEAAKSFTLGTTVAIIRPRGTTTSRIRELPTSVPLVVKPDRTLSPNDGRFESLGNLYAISMAWTAYRDVTKRLPPAVIYGPDGKPWHSWRVLILPYMEHYELYKRYNMREPWNSDHNLKLLVERPSYYRDPAREDPDPTLTHYVAITGGGTAFPSRGARMSDDLKFEAAKSPDTITVDAIKDGLENTLIVGNAPVDAKIPWIKPEDIQLTKDLPGLGVPGGFGAPYEVAGKRASMFVTAAETLNCVTVPATLPVDKLRPLFTIAGGEDYRIDDLPALPPPQRPRPPRTTVIEIRGSGKSATAELFDEIVPTREAPPIDN